MKIEIEASWDDVDTLTNAVDLVTMGDVHAAVLTAQTSQPCPKVNNATVGRLRSLSERIVGKLPPREVKAP